MMKITRPILLIVHRQYELLSYHKAYRFIVEDETDMTGTTTPREALHIARHINLVPNWMISTGNLYNAYLGNIVTYRMTRIEIVSMLAKR